MHVFSGASPGVVLGGMPNVARCWVSAIGAIVLGWYVVSMGPTIVPVWVIFYRVEEWR